LYVGGVLPQDCPHERVELRGIISGVREGWEAVPKSPEERNDYEAGWCRQCEHYVWRELGNPDWTLFVEPPSLRDTM
jgi:hypothetical protein